MPSRRSVLRALAAAPFVPGTALASTPAEVHTVDRRRDRSGPERRPGLTFMAGSGPLGTVLVLTRPADGTGPGVGLLLSRLDGGSGYEVDVRGAAELYARAFRETTFAVTITLDERDRVTVSALIEQLRRHGGSTDHRTVMGWLTRIARLARLSAPPDALYPAGFVRALPTLNR
jgi:hypothetical protein